MQSITDHLGSLYINGAAAEPTSNELLMLRAWIAQQWRRIPVSIETTPDDVTLGEAMEGLRLKHVLRISTVAADAHPYLTWTENIQFRAAHDWHHAVTGADASLLGEMRTYQYARNTAPSEIHWILRSEIILQAAAYFLEGTYQPQKLVRTK